MIILDSHADRSIQANGVGRPVALVTGASTGIGLEIARTLLENGFHVIITARRQSLQRLYELGYSWEQSNYWLRPLDVCNRLDLTDLYEEVANRLGRLDVLVNNAAIIDRGALCESRPEINDEIFKVNFWAPLELIRLFVPLMANLPRAYIINISSAAAFISLPTLGTYSASKQALNSISETLRHELAPKGIRLCVISPGLVRTEAARRTTALLSGDRAVDRLLERAFRCCRTTPRSVAKTVVQLVRQNEPPFLSAVTWDAWFIRMIARVPKGLYFRLLSVVLYLSRKSSLDDFYDSGGSPAVN